MATKGGPGEDDLHIGEVATRDRECGRGCPLMARQAKKSTVKSLEQRLWDAADALRGNQEPSEYKHVVLGLVFLKYISDRFEARRRDIEAALSDPESDDYIPNETRRQHFLEDRDEYRSHNVFWVPAEARWETIQAQGQAA